MKSICVCVLAFSFGADAFLFGESTEQNCDGICAQEGASGAEGARVIRAELPETIDSVHNGRLCGGAKNSDWETLKDYAINSAQVPITTALQNVRCTLARGTSDEYEGNMLHAAIRDNHNSQNITLAISNHLLRENPSPINRRVFVGLVRGVNGRPNIFYQLRASWTNEQSTRGLMENSARIICLSIDRYNIIELADIRRTECQTHPFVFPVAN